MGSLVIDVDAADFVVAADRAAGTARGVHESTATLRAGLSECSRMAGSDPAGLSWAEQYDSAAKNAVSALDSLEHAFGLLGAGLQITGLNYATADWLSAGGAGHAPGYDVPILPALARAAGPPSAAGGTRACDIPGWEYVANLVGDAWPDGDTALLRRAGASWDRLADDLDGIHTADASRIAVALDGTRTPELPTILERIDLVISHVTTMAQDARHLATACHDLADRIDDVHRRTERELRSLGDQLVATAAIGVGLTVVTAGLSDAAAGLAGGGEVASSVARILSFISELGTSVSQIVGTVASSAERLATVVGLPERLTVRIVTIVGDSVVTGVGGAATNIGATAVADPDADLSSAAVSGFVTGAALGVAGTGVRVGLAARASRIRLQRIAGLTHDVHVWAAAKGPLGYKPFGALSDDAWVTRYLKGFDANGHPDWKWPPHDGFVPGTARPNTLNVGDIIERTSPLGLDGSFATTPGASFEMLSLPPDRLSPAFVVKRYKVMSHVGPEVLEGPIAPHFEQPGLATQYFFPKKMQVLVNAGILQEVP